MQARVFRQGTSVTLIVLAMHALLLFSLPYWMSTVPVTRGPPVFLIRTIALAAPQSATAQPEAKPEPEPQPPKPKPHSAPQPSTVPDAESRPSARSQPPDQIRAQATPAPQSSLARIATLDAGRPVSSIRLPRSALITYQAVIDHGGRLMALPSMIDWRHDSQSYDLRWSLYEPATGERGRHARGRITTNGLAPETVPAGELAAGQPLPAGAQDPLSAWIELGALIAGNPSQYPVGSRIELPLAAVGSDQAPRRADYIVMDDNDIAAGSAFADQPLPALHLVHEPADEHDIHIELWLGRQMDYLPIRLLIIQPDGDRLDMTLQDIRAG